MASAVANLGHAAERAAVGAVIDGLLKNLRSKDNKRETYLKFMDLAKKFYGSSFTPEKMAAMGIKPGILPYGWWIGMKITDAEVWKKIKAGKYKMFSIEGRAKRVPVDEKGG